MMNTPILMYHEIGEDDSEWSVSPKEFEKQMNYLKEQGYETVGLDELNKKGKNIVLTFDDGKKGILNQAYPILKKLGFKAYLLVVSDWAEQKNLEFMNWDEINSVKDVFKIGCHGKSHVNLTKLSEEELEKEIKNSKKVIEEKTNQKVDCFAYPYGKFDTLVEKKVLVFGFDYILTCIKGFGENDKRLPRQHILRSKDFEEFKKLLKKPTVSLCMIVKNEEENLADCLDSVKDLVDEIIIVDTKSTDKTKEIAKKYTKKVYDFKWQNDFAAARNESLKQTTGDWILILDADEKILESEKEKIKQLVNVWQVDGFSLITKNYSDNSSIRGWRDGWFPSVKVRLFQNNKGIKFEGAVHELVEGTIKGKVERPKILIDNFGKDNNVDKREYYLDLAKKKLEKNPSAKVYHEVGVQYKELRFFKEAEEMFKKAIELDGKERVPYLDLAVVYKEQEKLDEAIKIYEELLKIGESGQIYFDLGVIYYKKNQLERAVESFERAIKLDSGNVEAYNNLGAMHDRLGNYEEAKEILIKGIRINPRNAKGYYNLGVVCEKEGILKGAIKAYEKAIELNYFRKNELVEKVKRMREISSTGQTRAQDL